MSAIISSSRRLGKKTKTKVPGDVDQNTHQRHLPFEIWSLVFSHLSTSDLTSVARVSRTFLPICRSALYRSLTLRSDNPNHIYTFNVLEHIKDLTGSVKHATFYTAWTPWMPAMPTTTWVDIDVFALLTGLRTLTLIGCPFILPDEQTKFVEVVGKRCPALRGFTYVPLYSMAFPSPSLEIRGLEFVTWPTFLSSSPDPQCVSLLTASLYTLTSLSFPTCPGYPINIGKQPSPDTWPAILNLHFPNLTSCHIGLMYPDNISTRQYDTATALTKFLASHSRLVHLALGTSADFAHVYEGLSGTSELVAPGFLPALRSLEVHPANVTLMHGQRVGSLHALTRLTLAYYIPHDQNEGAGAMVELLQALEGSAGFPHVEEFGLYFSGAFSEVPPVALQWVGELGKYFPKVLAWSGYLGVVLPWTLAEALTPYNLVKSVHLPSTTLAIMRTDGSISADDFTPIANACPQLATLTVKTHIQQSHGTKHVLNRNEDGVLRSITVTVP